MLSIGALGGRACRMACLTLFSGAVLAAPGGPARADTLPLERGVYVPADVPCAKVS